MEPNGEKPDRVGGITSNSTKAVLTIPNPRTLQQVAPVSSSPTQSKYVKLLHVIEQLRSDLKPFYTGNKLSKTMPKVERDLAKACRLVQQCRSEVMRNAKKGCQ